MQQFRWKGVSACRPQLTCAPSQWCCVSLCAGCETEEIELFSGLRSLPLWPSQAQLWWLCWAQSTGRCNYVCGQQVSPHPLFRERKKMQITLQIKCRCIFFIYLRHLSAAALLLGCCWHKHFLKKWDQGRNEMTSSWRWLHLHVCLSQPSEQEPEI